MSNQALFQQIFHYNTQYLGISGSTDSTVLKMPNNVLHGGVFSDNKFKSEEYLLNFRGNNAYLGNRMGASDFYSSGGLVTVSERGLEENMEGALSLPEPKKIKTSLSQAIIHRKSVRDYVKADMSLKDLSNILYYTGGVSRISEQTFDFIDGSLDVKLRNAPSAGGLYPIKLYFYCSGIKDIDEGFYIYFPEKHAIKKVRDKSELKSPAEYADFANIDATKVNLIICYVYDLFINSRKYGDIGAAFAFIEAGELAQNLQLVATALGYGACDIGGYKKGLVEDEIGLDGVTRHLIHMTIVGNEGEE